MSRKEYQKTYYEKNKEILKTKKINKLLSEGQTVSDLSRKSFLNNPKRYIFNRAKQSAKRVGHEFLLTLDDIEIPQTCPYLNIPLTMLFGEGHVDSNMSLDRIDSSKGYVKGNVEVISHLANKMKQNATKEQLIAFAQGVLQKNAV